MAAKEPGCDEVDGSFERCATVDWAGTADAASAKVCAQPAVLVPLLYFLAAANLVAFVAFGLDKRRARLRARRIPEAWLVASAFLGGLGGAWVAMSLFRHKTRKTSFRLKMAIVTVINPLWLLIFLWSQGSIR